MSDIKTAIGLMSGTSIDGVDVSLIKSDGINIIQKGMNSYYPYDIKTKKTLKKIIKNEFDSLIDIKLAEAMITRKHIEAVRDFLKTNELKARDVDVIGFSGHTIIHDPENLITWQIGNAHLLAAKTNIDVVADFRSKDIVHHGQGAPLVPIYHHSLLRNYPTKPVIILNIGGVSNITYLENDDEKNIIACDICFGNAPMDDLVEKMTDKSFDENGDIAKNGQINYDLADIVLQQDYFSKKPPKSLDRNHFRKLLNKELLHNFHGIKLEDALKTMCYIIAKSLEIIIKDLDQKPKEIIVCGGGRKNSTIMQMIKEVCQIEVVNIDNLKIEINNKKFDGDFIEAQAFAFLAIRHLKNLPITFRKTTGVLLENYNAQTSEEEYFSSCGGVFYRV